MGTAPENLDIAILGGGVIGLSIAWRAAQRGMSVAVLEREMVGAGASRVAAGMLAPASEAEFGEAAARLLDLGLRSAAAWPAFAEELSAASGTEIAINRAGTLMLAHDDDEARELTRQIELRESLGLPARRLRPSQARELEPALAPGVRLAMHIPEEGSVDPRPVIAALRVACERADVTIREHVGACEVALSDGGAIPARPTGSPEPNPGLADARASGVRLADGELVSASTVIVAAGAWSGQIGGVPPQSRPPVRPVKGQILRLRDPAGPGLATAALRYAGGYIVPRGDGRYVLGATVEEKGFDASPTAGGIHELLEAAREILPGITELQIEEIAVGFRPGTPDNTPIVGPSEIAGLIWATGHHRGGILLAPLTAELALEPLASGAAA